MTFALTGSLSALRDVTGAARLVKMMLDNRRSWGSTEGISEGGALLLTGIQTEKRKLFVVAVAGVALDVEELVLVGSYSIEDLIIIHKQAVRYRVGLLTLMLEPFHPSLR